MILWQATIPLNPKTKKNSQEIHRNPYTGKPFVAQSKAYTEYEQACGYFLRKPNKPINTPVNVKCVFYRESRIRCDLTNLLEAIDDVLVSYGVLSDDNFTVIASHDGSRVFIDRDNPRTEITISNFVPDVSTDGAQC